MEIKVGDKVRVSKDAPRIYTPDWIDEMFNLVLKVTKVEDGNAMVVFAKRTSYKTVLTAIPTKYLIKVDAEAKFKKGDKVRFKKIYTVVSVDDGQVFIDSAGNHFDEDCLELYTEPTAPTIKVGDMVRCKSPLRLKNSTDDDFIGMVTEVEGVWFRVRMNNGADFQTYHESDLELVQPKEQTEAEKTNPDNLKKIAEEWANEVSNAIAEYGDAMCKTYIEARNEAYWDAYTADLAKEIALKVANKHMDGNPEEIGAYAVSVAKAVVENLKKK